MDDRMGIYPAIRTECVASETLVAAVPELQCWLGKRIAWIGLDLQPDIDAENTVPANQHTANAVTGEIPSYNQNHQAVLAENHELRRRLRMLRDAMRMSDWLLLQGDYPEMRNWFDD